MAIRIGLNSTKVLLTEVGKKWFLEHYPQGIVYEYDPDKPFDIRSMGADFVELTCPMGIPYRLPTKVDGDLTFNMGEKAVAMRFQEKIKPMIASIRNELERIEMHAEPSEGGPDYDTISDLTDLIEGKLEDIRELIEDIYEEAEG